MRDDRRLAVGRKVLILSVVLLAVAVGLLGWSFLMRTSELKSVRSQGRARDARISQLEGDYRARGIPLPPATTTTTTRPARPVQPRTPLIPAPRSTTTTTGRGSTSTTTTIRPAAPPTTTSTSTTSTTVCAVSLAGRCVL